MKQLKKIIDKASVLIEALPYIQKFRDETVVIKFGGSAMENKNCYDSILSDATFMECVGMRPVIVHGGGKRISDKLSASRVKPVFLKGLRVTDAKTIGVVEDVLSNEINPDIVETLRQKGALAKGLKGQDLMQADKYSETDKNGDKLDWGFVGNITDVDTTEIESALKLKMIPVITPLASGKNGELYNINADEAAAAIARALRSKKLVFLSDIPGILRNTDDPESVLTTLSIKDIDKLMDKGIIDGGMLPKVQGAIKALEAGVKKVHIIDGRLPHSLLLEIFTDKGVGTEIINNE